MSFMNVCSYSHIKDTRFGTYVIYKACLLLHSYITFLVMELMMYT